MTTSTWDPSTPLNSGTSYIIDMTFIKKCIKTVDSISSSGDNLDNNSYGSEIAKTLATSIDKSEQEQHAPIMKLSQQEWLAVEGELSNGEIISLIKFFTIAEMKLQDWSGEKTSPVIWLSKLLRKRGQSIDKDLLRWIKANSDNKFLPYGPL